MTFEISINTLADDLERVLCYSTETGKIFNGVITIPNVSLYCGYNVKEVVSRSQLSTAVLASDTSSVLLGLDNWVEKQLKDNNENSFHYICDPDNMDIEKFVKYYPDNKLTVGKNVIPITSIPNRILESLYSNV